MKKVLSIIFAVILVFSISSCQKEELSLKVSNKSSITLEKLEVTKEDGSKLDLIDSPIKNGDEKIITFSDEFKKGKEYKFLIKFENNGYGINDIALTGAELDLNIKDENDQVTINLGNKNLFKLGLKKENEKKEEEKSPEKIQNINKTSEKSQSKESATPKTTPKPAQNQKQNNNNKNEDTCVTDAVLN